MRLTQRGIPVYKSAGFCIGHPLRERFGDPGVIIFHDKFRDLRPLTRGKCFEMLDNFSGAHDDHQTIRRKNDVLLGSLQLDVGRLLANGAAGTRAT